MKLTGFVEVPPVFPAVTGGGFSQGRPDFVDRAFQFAALERTVHPDQRDRAIVTGLAGGFPAWSGEVKFATGVQQAVFQQGRKGYARLAAFALQGENLKIEMSLLGLLDPVAGGSDINRVAFDPDPVTMQTFGDRAGRAGAEKRIEYHIARTGAGLQHPVEQGFRFLGAVYLLAVDFEPFVAGTQGQFPIAPHLFFVV